MKERVFLHLRHYTRSASWRRLWNALLADPAARFVLQASIVAEAGEPVNAGILAEPCHLALCIAPRGLLNRHAGVFERLLSAQDLAQLAIPDEIERLGISRRSTCHQTSYFLHPAACQHRVRARVNAAIEAFARRHQPDFQCAPAFERSASRTVHF